MALTDENGGGIPATMLVGPTGGQGNGNSWGDGGWWIVLLIIIIAAMNGGWGGNNAGNRFGAGAPIIVNDGGNGGSVQRGFDQASVMAGLNGLQSGISGLSTQLCGCCCDMQGTVNAGFAGVQQALCSGFAGTTAAVNGAQNALAQQMYGNQIADMERSFAAQTAMGQGFNGTQAGLADLKYVVATENCADRNQSLLNTRDIIESQNRNTQAVLDKLCALELDGVKGQLAQAQRENVGLQNQLNMAALRESQTAQNALIQQGFSNEVDQLYNRLNTCPVPSTPVYGRTPIFTCNQNQNPGCGCGCGGTF